ncbi:SDR family oxidoreductase [Duganella levis]|uniref:SDR family NAD(P)-dependent oxidoreductase n=1 Tax=Duganella levis TaxID=2692169 RepID=A0ABW9W0F3_9BURK|nr:SDR family oxidoreductase [Duganella levis]MYN27459.1 SDR family NAD(P)-dependent oxidoreductase [Duganella levis]
MEKLSKRVALVTGANKGIGIEIARQLGQAGARVLLAARDAGRGRAAAQLLQNEGLDVHPMVLDVTDPASVAAAAAAIAAQYGRLDILVNNAGINVAGDGAPSSTPVDVVRRVFETNFFGALSVTQALLPLLRQSTAGRIVNMSSTLGSLAGNADKTSPYFAARLIGYNASKAALNMLTVQLVGELGDSPIVVNSVAPGYVRTDLTGNQGYLSAAEGAAIPVKFALQSSAEPHGKFLDAEGEIAW